MRSAAYSNVRTELAPALFFLGEREQYEAAFRRAPLANFLPQPPDSNAGQKSAKNTDNAQRCKRYAKCSFPERRTVNPRLCGSGSSTL